MRFFLVLLSCYFLLPAAHAQRGYEADTYEALRTMWKAKNDRTRKQALTLYDRAFVAYPDSVEEIGLYKASVLAGQLGEIEKAFDYLERLVEISSTQADGWVHVAGEYSRSEYPNLLEDPRWTALEASQVARREAFFQRLAAEEAEFLKPATLQFSENPEAGIEAEFLPKAHRNYSIRYALSDTLTTSYFVALPEHYDPSRSYPMLVFLHGAVRFNAATLYQTERVLADWNRFYTKYAERDEVILVFPQADSRYNWMTTDEGFDYVPGVIAQIKRSINVDDNRVFVSGHSNGATGSFNYWLRHPTPFAAFFGFNTYPKVFTGGTFLKNGNHRPFVSFSTDQDYYYPPAANDSLIALTGRLGLSYEDHRYAGFPHWFPEFDESEPAVARIFEQIKTTERNPYPTELFWQTDDLRDGRVDWLEITQLDTTARAAPWQRTENFPITSWLSYNKREQLVVRSVEQRAFDYPRAAGAVRAVYADNRFELQTSRVGELAVYIAPAMVDLSQPVVIVVNGREVFSETVAPDAAWMREEYARSGERTQVFCRRVLVEVR